MSSLRADKYKEQKRYLNRPITINIKKHTSKPIASGGDIANSIKNNNNSIIDTI